MGGRVTGTPPRVTVRCEGSTDTSPKVTRWSPGTAPFLDARLRSADYILTGEGRFDLSSLSGKGPGALRERAIRADKTCVTFAGAVAPEVLEQTVLQQTALQQTGEPRERHPVIAISPPNLPLEQALAQTERYLAKAVERWLETI